MTSPPQPEPRELVIVVDTPGSSQTSQTSYTGDLATPTTDSYHGNDISNTKSVSFLSEEKINK